MANERMQEMVDITLAGKEYRVGCTPENQAALFEAVNFLNGRLRDMKRREQVEREDAFRKARRRRSGRCPRRRGR